MGSGKSRSRAGERKWAGWKGADRSRAKWGQGQEQEQVGSRGRCKGRRDRGRYRGGSGARIWALWTGRTGAAEGKVAAGSQGVGAGMGAETRVRSDKGRGRGRGKSRSGDGMG